MNLQERIDNLTLATTKLNLEAYHSILEQCVKENEFAATVFVYDHLLANGHKANKTTYKIIEPLHSKTVLEKDNIRLKPTIGKKLAPRRRIHKIMKGHNYTESYASAKIFIPKVKAFLAINNKLKNEGRIKLAKSISKGCNISFNDARFVITALKREGYLTNNKMEVKTMKSVDSYFK